MGQAENFQEWLNLCEQEFLNAGHFLPEECLPFIEKKWNKAHPSTSSGEEEAIASRFERFEQEREIEGITVSAKLERRIRKFPSDLEFTPKQISTFSGTNKNTTRRELQELTKKGTIVRVSRGRYKLA
jgi:Fic family protein